MLLTGVPLNQFTFVNYRRWQKRKVNYGVHRYSQHVYGIIYRNYYQLRLLLKFLFCNLYKILQCQWYWHLVIITFLTNFLGCVILLFLDIHHQVLVSPFRLFLPLYLRVEGINMDNSIEWTCSDMMDQEPGLEMWISFQIQIQNYLDLEIQFRIQIQIRLYEQYHS